MDGDFDTSREGSIALYDFFLSGMALKNLNCFQFRIKTGFF